MRCTGLLFVALGVTLASAEILRVAELTAPRIEALDRERTVVLLPGGILEEHGPYLPSNSDGYLNDVLTQRIADAIAARPGWNALVFPAIPLGNSGANDVGRKYSFPGTYAVRMETLRSVYMDLADELGAQRFRWVFVVHLHGAPNHSRALDQAGDYFHDTYGGRMVHVAGLNDVITAIAAPKTAEQEREDGFAIHAGMDETSWMLALRPDLVAPAFAQAPPQSAPDMAGLLPLAEAKGWPGYLGSPRLASAAHGTKVVDRVAEKAVGAVLKILEGADPQTMSRFATELEKSPPDVVLDAASLAAERERAARQRAWIAKKELVPGTSAKP